MMIDTCVTSKTLPVLYLIFNRPDLMEQSFAPIRAARTAQVFIAADGPRPDREGEVEHCAEARRIVEQVDWPCEVKTLLGDENLGCLLSTRDHGHCVKSTEVARWGARGRFGLEQIR